MSAYSKDNVFYIGEFDGSMEANILIPLHFAIKEQAKKSTGHIDFYINSYGGNAHLADHIVESMELAKRDGIVIRTMITGAAYSAGSVVAVAGSVGHRFIAPNAHHLIHYGTTYSEETGPEQGARIARFNAEYYKQTLKHYNKYCDIPNLEENLVTDDWYISARQSIKWGMADKLLDKYYPNL